MRVLVVLVALVVVGCTTPHEQPPPETTTTTRPVPTLKPLGLAAEPAWISSGSAREVNNLDVRDGLALVATGTHLALIDLATGTPRWAIESDKVELRGGGIARLAGSGQQRLVAYGGGLAVLTSYTAFTCAEDPCAATGEYGLMLLSAADGSVLRRTPVTGQTRDDIHLQAMDDRVALVAVGPGVTYLRQLPPERFRTVAYDVQTGSQLWERPGVWPVEIAGDTAVLSVGTNAPYWNIHPGQGKFDGGPISGLDLATGAPKWDLAERFLQAEVVATGDAAVVVRGIEESGATESVLFDTADGHELADLDDDQVQCVADDALVACFTSAGLAVYDDRLSRVDIRSGSLSGVGAGRIFLSGENGEHTVDAVGNEIDREVPGRVLEVAAGHLCFAPVGVEHEDDPVRCYAVSG